MNINIEELLNKISANLQNENQDQSNVVDGLSSTLKDSSQPEENDDEVQEEGEEEIPLTPEMEQANDLYHQAMKLINGTSNRQYAM